jgi:hypothetical protein
MEKMDTSNQPDTTHAVVSPETSVTTYRPDASELDLLYVLTCLLVGGAVELSELLVELARSWQARANASPKLLAPPTNETSTDLLRYAVVGFLFEGQQRIRSQTVSLGNWVAGSANMAANAARPVTNSWLMTPLRRPMQAFVRQCETEAARLIHRGRIEEAVSRIMARELSDEAVSLLLGYLGDKPEVRTLIQEQGFSMADEVMGEMQEVGVAADTFLETVVRRILHRGPRQSPPG